MDILKGSSKFDTCKPTFNYTLWSVLYFNLPTAKNNDISNFSVDIWLHNLSNITYLTKIKKKHNLRNKRVSVVDSLYYEG